MVSSARKHVVSVGYAEHVSLCPGARDECSRAQASIVMQWGIIKCCRVLVRSHIIMDTLSLTRLLTECWELHRVYRGGIPARPRMGFVLRDVRVSIPSAVPEVLSRISLVLYMIYYPPHRKYVELDVDMPNDLPPRHLKTPVKREEWKLSITLSWAVLLHMCVLLHLPPFISLLRVSCWALCPLYA